MLKRALGPGFAIALMACGGAGAAQPANAGSEAAVAEGGEHGHHGGDHGRHGHDGEQGPGEHPEFPQEVAAFHDVMAPIWHAEEGADKGALACEAAATLSSRAAAIRDAATPATVQSNEDTWRIAVAELFTATDALVAACADDASTAEARLTPIHDAFHALFEPLGIEH